MTVLPIVMGPQGPIPTPPATLRAQLTALVARTNPGYLNTLPGSLIEDIASTDVGALVIANQFMVDLINSVTPYGANAFLLNQLGVGIYGVQPANAGNTSVDLIFSGTPGFVIIPGFIVTDGTYQYICQNGGVIGSDGNSLPIHAVSPTVGTWAVPAGIVTGFVTSVPSVIQLSVVNPTDGIPSIASESEQSFRKRVLTAGLVSATGVDRFLKTLCWNIPGVVQRLVSARQDIDACQWIIYVGGGDPYQVAWAIYYALGAGISNLARPTIGILSISNDNPIVITTINNHNLLTGMNETLSQIIGMEVLNGQEFPVTVLTDKTLSIPYDGTTIGVYVSGGILSPNPILQEINLNSYPDNYLIPFILPPQQLVTIVCSWNTDAPNYISPQGVAQLAVPAIVDYINSLYVGVTPINVYDIERIFIDAVESILPSQTITVLSFDVSFDGVGYAPAPGTGVIPGDPNSYFYTTANNVSVLKIL